MPTPDTIVLSLESLRTTLSSLGPVLDAAILVACAAAMATVVIPAFKPYLKWTLGALLGVLSAGELVLIWFHVRLWQVCQVIDPSTGHATGGYAVPIWIESEKLYVWALMLAVIALTAKRHGDELRPMLTVGAVLLAVGSVFLGHPFTNPLPDFLAQYGQYLSAMRSADLNVAYQAFRSAESSRVYYYNAWYMWAHPPLLFFSYGAFVASFAATILMIRHRRSSYEQTAYRWARLGYLPLTLGMVVGLPWAIIAWSGEAWWWSGKVDMSLMMWVLYTAYLHSRIYLRRRGMWRVVAVLAILSFIALVLTYVTTYVVPGAHSVA